MNVLYIFTARDCDSCAAAKPHIEEFKRQTAGKVLTIICDATHRVVSLQGIDPKATPTYALVSEKHEILKKHVGGLTVEEMQAFAFGDFGAKKSKKKKTVEEEVAE